MAKSDGGRIFCGVSFRGKISIVLGCVLSFCALTTPFYHFEVFFNFHFGQAGYSAHCWSFMSSAIVFRPFPASIRMYGLSEPIYVSFVKDVIRAFSYPRVYFDAYWFSSWLNMRGLSGLLIALFAVQLSMLAAGLTSLLMHRGRMLRSMTVLLGAVIVGLMWLFCWNMNMNPYHAGSLQAGFFLAVLAEIVFAVGLVWDAARRGHMDLGQALGKN